MRLPLLVLIAMTTNCASPAPCKLSQFYRDPSAARGAPRYVTDTSLAVADQGVGTTIACVACSALLAVAPDGTSTSAPLPALPSGPGTGLDAIATDPDGGAYLAAGGPIDPGELYALDAAGDIRWQVDLPTGGITKLYANHDAVYVYWDAAGNPAQPALSAFAATDGTAVSIAVPSVSAITATADALYLGAGTTITQVVSGSVMWTRTLTSTSPAFGLQPALAPLANGGVGAFGTLDGTLDLGGTTVTATQGVWYAEWNADGTLAWAVGINNDQDLNPELHGPPMLAAVGDQLITAFTLSPTIAGMDGAIHVVDATGPVASYAISTGATAFLVLSGLISAGDGSLWLQVGVDDQCTSGCPTTLQFGSQTWSLPRSFASTYSVNFLP